MQGARRIQHRQFLCCSSYIQGYGCLADVFQLETIYMLMTYALDGSPQFDPNSQTYDQKELVSESIPKLTVALER